MKDAWLPLIAAIIGGLIGTASNLLSLFLNGRAERRRELTRLAVQAAIEDHKQVMAYVQARPGLPAEVPPLAYYVHGHWRMFKLYDSGHLSLPALEAEIREHAKYRPLFGLTPSDPQQPSPRPSTVA